jgi:hypothetical protein
LKARLAGAQQVVTKPLTRQRIVALVSEHSSRWASDREADRQTSDPTCDDRGVASCLRRE